MLTNSSSSNQHSDTLTPADTRSGSALLIVVGTLALIAVFAAIYISIGQSDQRVASSVKNNVEVESIRNTIANHISGVVGMDRYDYTVGHRDRDTSDQIFTVLETTDAPYTDWFVKSESMNLWDRFNPSGRSIHDIGGTNPSAANDYRVASDPWLASTLPTYLGDPGLPGSGVDQRPFASLLTDTFDTTQLDNYIGNYLSSGFLDNRDYLQISNLAPDGRFVNLFNLRANTAQQNGFNDSNIGGFDSEPGTGTFDRDSDSRTIRRMSNYLSLWKQEQTGDPSSRIQAFDPEDEGIWLPGRNEPDPNHGLTDLTNIPAVYTMYQRFAFLPLNQPFITVNRNNQISTWADPDYAPYQWADTNGDGMADARWFELVSAREENSTNPTPRDDIERLYDAGQYRIFAAARVVDLSSMVNVNTATDQLLMPEPVEGAPLGATPAEVDLRRLLSMSDAAENYSISNPLSGASLSPSQWHRPRGSRLNPMQNFPEQTRDDDYFYYLSFIERNTGPDPKFVKPHSVSLNVGRYAYNAIKRGIQESSTLDDRYFAWPPEIQSGFGATPAPAMPSDFDTVFNSPPLNTDETNPASSYRLDPYFFDPMNDTAVDRADYYKEFGTIDPTTSEGSSDLQTSALYNNNDLFELLAFHGLNDPSRISRLEKNAMGRMPSIFQQNQRAFSPLFSNRQLEFDRMQHGYVEENGYSPAGGYPIDPDPNAVPRRIEGSIAKESMSFFATSPRRLLTTVSGASHLKPGALITVDSPSIEGSQAPVLSEALGDVSSLFSIYSGALLGELTTSKLDTSLDNLFVDDLTTTRSDGDAGPNATLFYGHRGPELAMRIAAHTAANMKDLNDSDSTPTAVTLILDDERRDDLIDMYDPTDLDTNAYSHYAGRATNNILNTNGMTPNQFVTGDQRHRQAVDVFGIEPMPFLTEMSSLYVYVDSEDEQGSVDGSSPDDASPDAPRNLGPFTQFPNPLVEVTINGDVNSGNKDFKLQVLAFQLTNPWNEAITIGGGSGPMGYIDEDPDSPTNTNLQFEYYIEFGGRFFKIGEFVEFNPSLDAGDTIGLYGDDGDDSPDVNQPIIQTTHEEYQYQGVTIPANSSRVFYAMAHGRFINEDGLTGVDADWLQELGNPSEYTDVLTNDPDGDGRADGNDGQDWTGPAREWIDSQFRTRSGLPPVHIHQFDPTTGHLVEQNAFYDLMQSPTTDAVFDTTERAHDHTQARLWRKITGSLEESIEDSLDQGQTRENLIQNDMLVDRLKLPTEETLDRSLPGGNQAIEGSFGYDTAVFPRGSEVSIGARNDNFGLTMARWATVRKLDNAADATDYDSGKIGAWMLNSRVNPDNYTNFTHDPNDEGDDGDLDIADFLDNSLAFLSDPENLANDKGDLEVDRSFLGFWDNSFGSSRRAIIQTLTYPPYNKWRITASNNPLPFGVDPDYYNDRFPVKRITSNTNGQVLHGTDSELIPELLPNARGFNDAPRLADLLLAWGIGPTHTPDPDPDGGFGDVSFDDTDEGLRWMTLSEAIAIGLGYETVNAYTPSEPAAENIWYQAMGINGNVLDNGHLAIDRFVSYYNVDHNSELTEPFFDSRTDVRRGSGIPMALGVIDQARPLVLPTMNPASTDPNIALKTPTFGLININTAPPEVLRLLPGLSPSRTLHYPDNQSPSTQSEWWANNDGNTGLQLPTLLGATDASIPPSSSPENRTPDVAATLAAYRDRTYTDTRFMSTSMLPGASGNPIRYFTNQSNSALVGQNMIGEQSAVELALTNDFRDRASIAGVDGLRSTPGFSSMGEVLMATIGPDAEGAHLNSGTLGLRSYQQHLDIQQYGLDTLPLDGGNSFGGVAIDPQLFAGSQNGGTVDDYAERLAMANGILNTISVRSDYYAVWFIVHAYQESDVANLQPEDPLVPSLAKRYVMVIDRTNVIDRGDSPRIVFLKEVPM
ncbi:MAG: hypothetical protein ACSHX5_03155 [Phycisphaerales bacterium]